MMLTTAVVAALTIATSPADAGESPMIPRASKSMSAAGPTKGPTKQNAALQDAATGRGKRLVETHDCHACHTPMKMGPKGPEPDTAMALSGHPEKLVMPPPPKLDGVWGWVGSASSTAFAGPWGITYAANLTPDPDTGLGKWREEDFVQAMKTGKHMGTGRQIMPPMPWAAYGQLSDIALKAMFSYLKTVPPIKNRVPDYAPPK
jgi:mono/diheme cytochrome c family protein